MASTKTLICRAQAGDESAFTELMRAHYAFVYAVVIGIVSNPNDAEEVVQDTFLNAYRGLAQYEDREKFKNWLAKIARNSARDWLRKPRVDTVSIDEVSEHTFSTTDLPDEQLIRDEQRELIRRAMGTLSQKDREIARAYYLEDATYDELIRTHGLSYKAISFRLSRAKQKLAKRLGHLLTGVFGFPASTLKHIYSGGLTVMKVGTVPKITAGIVAIIVLAFIGTRQFISSEEDSSPSVEVVISTPSESANSVAQTDATGQSVTAEPSREDKPQISAEEMQQIEDFFAQLDEADPQSETDTSHLPTDGASGQDSETDNTGPSVASEDTGLSAEDVMNTYVEAFKNVDFEKMRLLMTGSAKERSRLHEDLLRNNHYIDFTEARTEGRVVTEEMVEVIEEKNMELKQQLEHQIFESLLKMYSQVEVVNSEYIGGEFHFQLRMPVSPIHQGESEAIMGSRESQEEVQAVLRAVFPEDIEQSVKMRNENGAWLIYENGS